MIILDTSVISEATRLRPDPGVAEWLRRTDPLELYLCTPVVAELAYGAERISLRSGSGQYLKSLQILLRDVYAERLLPFDRDAALRFGKLRATRENGGRPISVMDGMIAAICLAHGAGLATRNVREFEHIDLSVVNPFVADPGA